MKTHIIIGIVVLCLASIAAGEDPYEMAWMAQIGTTGSVIGKSVAADVVGGVYVSGYTDGDLYGANAGSQDAFLARYDSLGNELWSRQVGTPGSDISFSVAMDGVGNAYISGATGGDLGGANAGSVDAFLIKYDPYGNELWSQQIGTPDYDLSWSVAVDATGNAYISGYTEGDLGGPNSGSMDAFLTKFDASGSELWTRQIGPAESHSVAVDSSGSIYISGSTGGSLGGPNAGNSDAFLAKYDASGNEVWIAQTGSTGHYYDVSRSVAVDAAGNVYISGYTEGDLGEGSSGAVDAFLIKYDPSGALLWSEQIGTTEADRSFSVAVDGLGNAYITGRTHGNLADVVGGIADVFLIKYDPYGNLLWSDQIGTEGTDEGYSVAVDATGNVYLSGYTGGDLGGPNAGIFDAFLVKYEPVPEPATMGLLALGGVVLMRRRGK